MEMEDYKRQLETPGRPMDGKEIDRLIEIEKALALREIGRCLSVCAMQLDHIEANTRDQVLEEAIEVLLDEHNKLFAHVGQQKHSMEPVITAMRELFKVYAREDK